MNRVSPDVTSVGFVASETSKCNELETSAAYCARTGQVLVINSTKALQLAHEQQQIHPGLRVRADIGAWRRSYATPDDTLADVDNLFGFDGWCEQQFPVSGGVEAYTPSRFLRADDRASRQALLAQTADLPSNITTRIAIEAGALDSARRRDFFDDLAGTTPRRFAFVFGDKSDPLARYQRLDGLRQLLALYPGSEIDHVDPLVAADALAHGAGWVGVGASSARRMPRRPEDTGGQPMAAGYLPGLFLEELLELRSPQIYSDWYANAASPYCRTCGRALDLFEPTVEDKAVIVAHNLHQSSDHIAALIAQPAADRVEWLRQQRLAAHARHVALNALGDMILNQTLRRFLELDDPQLREMTRAGAWKA